MQFLILNTNLGIYDIIKRQIDLYYQLQKEEAKWVL